MYYHPSDVANSPNNHNCTSRRCAWAVDTAVLLFLSLKLPVPQKRVSRRTETELQITRLFPHSLASPPSTVKQPNT